MKYRIFTCLGKGGTGKTAISTLIGRYFIERNIRPLFIDADPVSGLQKTLSVGEVKTIANAKSELAELARSVSENTNVEQASHELDYIIMNVLREYDKFGFIAIGQTYSTGCFCAINNLLRDTISRITTSYPVVIIDAEAGIEQVNRLVVEKVDYALLVTDMSRRGIDTCLEIKKAVGRIESMKKCSYGAIINKCSEVNETQLEILASAGISLLGCVPLDPLLEEADIKGKSLLTADGLLAYDSITNILDGL